MAVDDLQSKAAELAKKVLTVGVGAIFLTEESLRGLVSELKLPKELLKGILDASAKTRNEFLRSLSQDVLSRVVDRVDPVSFVSELLQRNDIEFTIKLNVKPKGKAAQESEPTEEEASSEEAESNGDVES